MFVCFVLTRRTPYINNNLGSTTTTTACPPTQSSGASGSNNPSTFHQTHTGTSNNSSQFSTISPNHHGRSSTPTSATTTNTHNNSSSNISDHDRSDTGRSRNTQQHLPKEDRRMQGIILTLYFVVYCHLHKYNYYACFFFPRTRWSGNIVRRKGVKCTITIVLITAQLDLLMKLVIQYSIILISWMILVNIIIIQNFFTDFLHHK